jgi:hypothetical protein
VGKLEEKSHLEDRGVYESMGLKSFLQKWAGEGVWIRFTWLRIRISGIL